MKENMKELKDVRMKYQHHLMIEYSPLSRGDAEGRGVDKYESNIECKVTEQ
ncbi:MAG: hypothetical protein Q7J16_13000 [Candidatus Cloacimonadales bacterium]|nr:hypothetical protein [Candidatus Cloacimonadales bacterium]